MAGSIADNDRARTAIDRRRIQALDHCRIAAAGVFGHVHDFDPKRNSELNRLLGGLKQEVFGPTFGVAANGTRPNERGGIDFQARAMRNLGNRANVVFVRACGAVRMNFHPVVGDLSRQCFYMFNRARSGAGEAQIERINSQRLHQMENPNLFLTRGVADRRRLQPVAQSFVVQLDWSGGHKTQRQCRVPVVDEFERIHRRLRNRILLYTPAPKPPGFQLVCYARRCTCESSWPSTLTMKFGNASLDLSLRCARLLRMYAGSRRNRCTSL